MQIDISLNNVYCRHLLSLGSPLIICYSNVVLYMLIVYAHTFKLM